MLRVGNRIYHITDKEYGTVALDLKDGIFLVEWDDRVQSKIHIYNMNLKWIIYNQHSDFSSGV